MKIFKLLLVFVILAWFFAVAYGAYRVYLSFDISDPLRLSRIALKSAELERLTEQERQKTEREKRETAKTLAKLRRQELVENHEAVSVAAVTLATFTRLFPVLLFSAASIGGLVFAFTRRVRIESPICGEFPRRDAFQLASMALQVQYAEAAGRVAAFSEDTTRHRLQDFATIGKTFLRGVNTEPAALLPGTPQTAVENLSFSQAVRDFRQHEILIGYDSGSPVFFPIEGFVSCAFGGGSGSGKTSKLRFLTAQLILNGVNVSILDAHQGNKESLVDSLGELANMPNVRIFPPFETRQAVKTMLSDVRTVIAGGKPADVPCVYVLDELKPLNRACSEVETLFDVIANEGRKYLQFMVASSQTWEASLFGKLGSAARDACVLKMAARMPKEQARTLFKDGETARTVAKLARPEMFADSMQFSGVVNVPFCSRDDMDTLAAKFGAGALPRNAEHEIDDSAIDATPETFDTSEGVLRANGYNVIPFPKREPTNQLRTKSEPERTDVKALRESAGVSQGKFAELTGCSLSKLKKVETNAAKFDDAEISQILTNFEAWQKSGEPSNQLRTKGEPGAKDGQTKPEPKEA